MTENNFKFVWCNTHQDCLKFTEIEKKSINEIINYCTENFTKHYPNISSHLKIKHTFDSVDVNTAKKLFDFGLLLICEGICPTLLNILVEDKYNEIMSLINSNKFDISNFDINLKLQLVTVKHLLKLLHTAEIQIYVNFLSQAMCTEELMYKQVEMLKACGYEDII